MNYRLPKYLLILLFWGLSSLASIAQSFDLYGYIGPVVSQVDGDRTAGYNKLGGRIGIGLTRPFEDKWNGLMELGYIQKGKGAYNETTNATFHTSLNYIELPIMVEYIIKDNLRVHSGLSFDFLMSYQFYEDGIAVSSSRYDPHLIDFSWVLGGNYSINEQWSANLRFSYSIIPMALKPNEVDYSPNPWVNPNGLYNSILALSFQRHF